MDHDQVKNPHPSVLCNSVTECTQQQKKWADRAREAQMELGEASNRLAACRFERDKWARRVDALIDQRDALARRIQDSERAEKSDPRYG